MESMILASCIFLCSFQNAVSMPILHTFEPTWLFFVLVILPARIWRDLVDLSWSDHCSQCRRLDQSSWQPWCLRIHPSDTFWIDKLLGFSKACTLLSRKSMIPFHLSCHGSVCCFCCVNTASWCFDHNISFFVPFTHHLPLCVDLHQMRCNLQMWLYSILFLSGP